MSARTRSRAVAALFATGLAGVALAAEPKLPRDGWVSWDVPAIDDAPASCCFESWKDHGGTPGTCKLDGHMNNHGSRDHETTDTVTVYARAKDGKLDRLRVLSATCPVETNTPVQELTVTPDDSARWLIAQIGDAGSDRDRADKGRADNALAGLAMHRGAVAHDGLVSIGRANARAHVRSEAWFWLAMSGAAGAESDISGALRQDPDDHVREEAVFALSRLPEERATRALIGTAEDKSLSREQRKRAVFWLSQSESPAALAFLDKVLAASSVPQK